MIQLISPLLFIISEKIGSSKHRVQMCGHTGIDKIMNETIREKVEVANIEDKLRELQSAMSRGEVAMNL